MIDKVLANKIYDILVEYGASKQDHVRHQFVQYFTEEGQYKEFRFMGIFGSGGKCRYTSHTLVPVYCNYYPESGTKELDAKMDELNEKIAKLFE
jgi:hypothetical protein